MCSEIFWVYLFYKERDMKKILIFIDYSLGELDWIAPFILSKEASTFDFYIYLNAPGNNDKEKKAILTSMGLKQVNVHYANSLLDISPKFIWMDEIINKILDKIKKNFYVLFKYIRIFTDRVRRFFSNFIKQNKKIKFDIIFRDYNLKESFALSTFLVHNKDAKIVVFPHAVGLQKYNLNCPRESFKYVKADLWLENSNLSDLALKSQYYKNIFYATGAPSFEVNYKKPPLFDKKVKTVLILTRDCGFVYGFSYEDALLVFNEILEIFDYYGFRVLVKHHPRDKQVEQWRNVQAKFSNVSEYTSSLNNISQNLCACFSFFSTAGIFLLSRKVPIFEISPYKKCEQYSYKMPFHFCGKNDYLSHDLLELGIFKRLKPNDFSAVTLSEDSLEVMSKQQYAKCQEIFPSGANKKIAEKLESLVLNQKKSNKESYIG